MSDTVAKFTTLEIIGEFVALTFETVHLIVCIPTISDLIVSVGVLVPDTVVFRMTVVGVEETAVYFRLTYPSPPFVHCESKVETLLLFLEPAPLPPPPPESLS